MANAGSSPGDVFEVRKVRRLVELMNEHDLAEIDPKGFGNKEVPS